MSAKQGFDQHQLLHTKWPDDCCLCNHEKEAKRLRGELELWQKIAKADAVSHRTIMALRALLVEADRLYSTYGLVAGEASCGAWIGEVRKAIATEGKDADAGKD